MKGLVFPALYSFPGAWTASTCAPSAFYSNLQGHGLLGDTSVPSGPPPQAQSNREDRCGSTTETTERLNLTQDAMEKLAEEPVMMTQAWVPDSGGHPEKSSRPVGTRDRKEQEWTS